MKKKNKYTFLGRYPLRLEAESVKNCYRLYDLNYKKYPDGGLYLLEYSGDPNEYFETKEEAEFMIAIRGLDVYRFPKYEVRHAIPFSEIKKDDVRV